MVKHTQVARQYQPTNCLSMFDHFVGLALNCLMSVKLILLENSKQVPYPFLYLRKGNFFERLETF